MRIPFPLSLRVPFLLVLLLVAACATTQPRVFDKPAPAVPSAHKKVFEDAFKAQERGQYTKAIGLWKEYLNQEPGSAAAHNNLGMIFYTEDRLPESIQQFEQAMEILPGSPIIRENLSRSLQFEIALLKENREYERAISHLKRLQELSRPEEFQKVQFMIEEMEDKIFEQVQNANSKDEYQRFLEQHPTGVNAEKARQKLAEMERHSSVARPFEDLLPVEKEGVIGADGVMEAAPPIMEESVGAESTDFSSTADDLKKSADGIKEEILIESLADGAPPGELEDLSVDKLSESPAEEAPTMEDTTAATAPEPQNMVLESPKTTEPMAAAPETTESAEPKPPAKAVEAMAAPVEKAQPEKKVRDKVMVTLRSKKSMLRVRAKPTIDAKILSLLRNGDVRPMVRENPQWYQIEYKTGKTGWIHKKFSKKLEAPDAQKGEPQARRRIAQAARLSLLTPVPTRTSLQPQFR